MDRGYLGRVLRLTLLVPDIAEKILHGRKPDGVTPPRLMDAIPLASEQRATLGG